MNFHSALLTSGPPSPWEANGFIYVNGIFAKMRVRSERTVYSGTRRVRCGLNFGLGRAQLRGPPYPDEPTSRVRPLTFEKCQQADTPAQRPSLWDRSVMLLRSCSAAPGI